MPQKIILRQYQLKLELPSSPLEVPGKFQETRSCIRLLECPAAMLDSVTGLSPTVSSRALLFSPTHKRAPFYVRSSNPRAWDELCYLPPPYTIDVTIVLIVSGVGYDAAFH